MKKLWLLIPAAGLLANISLAGPFVAGRDISSDRDASFRFTGGMVFDIEGDVQETNRRYYEVTGQSEKQNLREDYSLEDFGLGDAYPTVGFAIENAGRFWTFQWDLLVMNLQTDSTAIRNYYIGVSDIEYGGEEYEYMQIPEGTDFSVDILGIMTDLRLLFTPFTFKPGNSVRFTPFADIGLFIFYASCDIDAGPARGVIQYQDPPEDFVVGGHAEGMLALGVPELGVGAELRIGNPSGVNLVVQGNYGFLDYDGSTEWLVSADHRAKDLTLNHINARAKCALEAPFENGNSFVLGIEYRFIESEASITTREDLSDEEIAERHERFDKDAFFSLSTALVTLGWTF